MKTREFKVYVLDVGLLGAMCNLSARTILDSEALFSSFKGALAEQLVAQELLASGRAGNKSGYGQQSCTIFMNQSTRTEIDFIVDGNEQSAAARPLR